MEIIISAYDPIIKAFRECKMDKDEAKKYLAEITKTKKTLEEQLNESGDGD